MWMFAQTTNTPWSFTHRQRSDAAIHETGLFVAASPLAVRKDCGEGRDIETPRGLCHMRNTTMIRTTLIAAAALLIAAPALAVAVDDAKLALTFDASAPTGTIVVALYDAATYNGGQPIRVALIKPAGGQTVATFEGLAAGDYGVKAFHDLNGDGRMDTNPFGMPTEPYAFSNNAVGNMGPASWDRAKFTVSGSTAQTISIH